MKGFDHDHVSDLDVPGSELDDAQENWGMKTKKIIIIA
jgi:hypothetical protein